MWHFKVILRMAFLSLLHCGLSYSCGSAEYEMNGKCCQMCAPGMRVYRHCTEYTSTACFPCAQKWFTDQLNSLSICLHCRVCASVLGLKTERECSPTSDTVCGPLDHRYCAKTEKNSCRFAQKHTICRPGQYIIHKGTRSTNTKCGDCPDKTFSNESSSAHCIPHTDCQSLGQKEITAGTNTSDTECGPTPHVTIVTVAVLFVVPAVVFIVIFILRRGVYCMHKEQSQQKRKKRDRSGMKGELEPITALEGVHRSKAQATVLRCNTENGRSCF